MKQRRSFLLLVAFSATVLSVAIESCSTNLPSHAFCALPDQLVAPQLAYPFPNSTGVSISGERGAAGLAPCSSLGPPQEACAPIAVVGRFIDIA